jgi:TyrR family helix-turn-helix protein
MPEDLPVHFLPNNTEEDYSVAVSLKEKIAQLEAKMIAEALKKYGTTRKAARYLGISQSALVKKANKYGIKNTKIWEYENQ